MTTREEKREVEFLFAAKVLEAVPIDVVEYLEKEAKKAREGATRANYVWEMAQKLRALRSQCLNV
jgi:hypothetical protein